MARLAGREFGEEHDYTPGQGARDIRGRLADVLGKAKEKERDAARAKERQRKLEREREVERQRGRSRGRGDEWEL